MYHPLKCLRCNHEANEDIMHALWSCPATFKIWKIVGWWQVIKSYNALDVSSFLIKMKQRLTKEEFELFSVLVGKCTRGIMLFMVEFALNLVFWLVGVVNMSKINLNFKMVIT